MDYILDVNGNQCTYLDGELHSYDDKPAMIQKNGTKFWFKNGLRHRDTIDPDTGLTLPAIISPNGDQVWFKDNMITRDDTVIVNGVIMSLPSRIYANGIRIWIQKNKLHRTDIDPITRLRLPAIIYPDGTTECWVDDNQVTQ